MTCDFWAENGKRKIRLDIQLDAQWVTDFDGELAGIDFVPKNLQEIGQIKIWKKLTGG